MRFQKFLVFGVLLFASLATGSSSFAADTAEPGVFEEKIVKDLEALDAQILCQDGENLRITFEKTQIVVDSSKRHASTLRFGRTPTFVSKATVNSGEARYFMNFYQEFRSSLPDFHYHFLVVTYSVSGKIKHIEAGTTAGDLDVDCTLK